MKIKSYLKPTLHEDIGIKCNNMTYFYINHLKYSLEMFIKQYISLNTCHRLLYYYGYDNMINE